MSVLILVLLTGCATNGKQAPATEAIETPSPTIELQAGPVPGDRTETVDSDCMKQCTRQNMARAVSAEVIEADCRNSCAQEVPSKGPNPSED